MDIWLFMKETNATRQEVYTIYYEELRREMTVYEFKKKLNNIKFLREQKKTIELSKPIYNNEIAEIHKREQEQKDFDAEISKMHAHQINLIGFMNKSHTKNNKEVLI